MQLPFQTCWDRVARAEFHRQALIGIWNGLDTSKVYETTGDVGNDGTGKIFIRTVQRDWLLPFSLQFGEMLYQLRAALDSCVYDAAILKFTQDPPPDKEKWEFVVGADAAKFEEAMRRMKKIIPNDVRGLIEAVQPYARTACRFEDKEFDLGQILEILNNWARIDRHRRLHLAGTAITDGGLRIGLPEGMTLESCDLLTGEHLLEHEGEIARFKIANFVPGTKVHVQPHFTFEITVDETPRLRLQEISLAMGVAVQAVREIFEKHFNITR
jgi:hypothetical protein